MPLPDVKCMLDFARRCMPIDLEYARWHGFTTALVTWLRRTAWGSTVPVEGDWLRSIRRLTEVESKGYAGKPTHTDGSSFLWGIGASYATT